MKKNIRTFKNKSLFNGNDLCSAFSGTFQCCLYPYLCCCKNNHIQAQEWRHIQTLTTSVGEILEDSDGTAKSFVSLFPDGQIQDNLIEWYYDSSWQLCSDSQASYKMELTLHETANPRQGTLTFYHATNDIQIYTIDLVFPIIENSDKEASS